MNKNIVLFTSLLILSSSALSEMPDFCNTGAYTCHQTGPNSVVAYPIPAGDSRRASEYKTRTNPDTYYKTPSGLHDAQDTIKVDLSNLTWSAYDNQGQLVRSGRVSGGKNFCPDTGSNCQTVTGTFTVYRKGGEDCKSTRFPVGKGGAPMPYCMFFHGGFALHGANYVPAFNVSHGCVRMPLEDAQWLNEEFVQEGYTKVNVHY